MRPRFAGNTDVGLLRERNEDSFLVLPRYRFAAVADGMGGHLSGDVASSLAISTIREFYSSTVGPDRTWPFPYDNDLTEEENCVVVGVRLANQHVFGRARRSSSESGMGTTIVALMFTAGGEQVIVGHVGDSRCYRVREGHITQLTSDHSLVSEVTEIAPWLSDEEVRQLPSNVITRALGMAPDVVVDLLTTDTRLGDCYLLCSDGLNGMIGDPEILEAVTSSATLDEACEELIRRANAAGGNDNTTVVLVRVEPAGNEGEEPAAPRHGGAIEVLSRTAELAALMSPSLSDDEYDDADDEGERETPVPPPEDGEAPTPTPNDAASDPGAEDDEELADEDTNEAPDDDDV